MKEILPFLLAIAFFGFKLYSKTKKKQAQYIPPPVPQTENAKQNQPSLDDFVEQFFGGVREQFTEPQYEEEESAEEEKNAWMEEMHREEPESIEYTDNTMPREDTNMQFEMIQNKQSKTGKLLDFDLRKAVIYDAIMNPPYL